MYVYIQRDRCGKMQVDWGRGRRTTSNRIDLESLVRMERSGRFFQSHSEGLEHHGQQSTLLKVDREGHLWRREQSGDSPRFRNIYGLKEMGQIRGNTGRYKRGKLGSKMEPWKVFLKSVKKNNKLIMRTLEAE